MDYGLICESILKELRYENRYLDVYMVHIHHPAIQAPAEGSHDDSLQILERWKYHG